MQSYNSLENFTPRVGVIGLGYVGLPVALGFAAHYPGTLGYDIHRGKIDQLKKGIDPTREGLEPLITSSGLCCTADIADLSSCNFFVVAVPTPVDVHNNPDLTPLVSASRALGKVIRPGTIVVYESTVYPGVTEDVCGPVLEEVSGLKRGKDFFLGYSPERINPGDKEHTLEKIIKVVSGENPTVLDIVARTYGKVITAGVFKAANIMTAEAAKVIENTQRDLNIALMNELSIIFDLIGIRTTDVLAAAGTKWNFLPFRPGLVGGHCIGVDPFYLTTMAEKLGYYPRVILAGRRINDNMGRFVAQKLVKLMSKNGTCLKDARVGVLGITFKENVADLRNSKVPSIISELREYGVNVVVHDPLADSHEAFEEYGLELNKLEEFSGLDACILAVSHGQYLEMGTGAIEKMLKPGAVVVDIKSVFSRKEFGDSLTYWSL